MPEPLRSVLSEAFPGNAARLREYHGALLPEYYSDAISEHRTVRNAAGLFDASFRVLISAGGNDRVRFLHGMVSNDVRGLAAGQGTYATLLDTRGHILADLVIYCAHDCFLIETHADLADKVLQTLNHYNIGGRVPLARLDLAALLVQGPKSGLIVKQSLGAELPGREEFCHAELAFSGQPLRIARVSTTGEEGCELWIAPAGVKALWNALLDGGGKHGLIACGVQALETLRIEAGTPAYGSELGEDVMPLEADLLKALSFTKGCYVGQEIVERTRSRGHVNWKLIGFWIRADQSPAPGEKLLAAGKEVGELTSACWSPSLARVIALGYARREFAEPGTALTLPSGAVAEATPVPFYRHDPSLPSD